MGSPVSLFLFLSFFLIPICNPIDIIEPKNTIKDGEKVVSANNVFALGFFSPPNSTNRYVGVWYNQIQELTVIWIANRENPLRDSSGVLEIDLQGNLVILNSSRSPLWSTNISSLTNISQAQLSDAGNLILREVGQDSSTQGRTLWESFNHATDTFLPTMKISLNTKTNEKNQLTSWRTASDPSIGTFSLGIDSPRFPQGVIWNGSVPYWRTGPWNGQTFLGVPEMEYIYLNGFSVNRDIQEGTIDLFFQDSSFHVRLVLDPSGVLRQLDWDEKEEKWNNSWSAPDNKCDFYGACGPFGTCNKWASPICKCLRGFEPKQAKEWNKGNWSGGCVRRNQWQCEKRRNGSSEVGKKDGFWKMERVKLPDSIADSSSASSEKECEEECLRNCSCGAYAYDEGGIGCAFWNGDLVDIQEFTAGGALLHIRLASSDLDEKKNVKLVIILVVLLLGVVMILTSFFCLVRRCMAKQRTLKNKEGGHKRDKEVLFNMRKKVETSDTSSQATTPELPIFSFRQVASATNNFSNENKLGEGGYGPVYKGMLPEGQEVAVKRLSKSSGQGSEEFKNEALIISKVQHRNLVRLLGCCIESEEKILVYEYLPKKSLDAFLFGSFKQELIHWDKRFHIIEGIARGILYLHRDSRLKIIHRDLKASNILLDERLNPKISDFGMARILGGEEILARTNRVVGTYGYMSPEYAMEGSFSEKSDVFSFGVLLLEIVSGKRNSSFYRHEQSTNLLLYTWKLWNERKVLELVDAALDDSYPQEEVLRCIHLGLLCVQEFAEHRPTMSSVIFMLSCDISTLPTPKQPAFTERSSVVSDSSQKGNEKFYVNEATISVMEGR